MANAAADDPVISEMKMVLKGVMKIKGSTKIADHQQAVENLTRFLEERSNRSKLGVGEWEDIAFDVDGYLKWDKKGKNVKYLQCHVQLIEKMFVFSGGKEANKNMMHVWTAKFLRFLLHVVTACDGELSAQLLAHYENRIKEMLKFPEYRSALAQKTISDMATKFMKKLQSETSKEPAARVRHLVILQHLVLEMCRDEGLMTDKADELFDFLQSFAEGIGRRGESEADVKSKFFRVVTEVLLTFSPEQYAKAKDLCSSLHNLLKESWSGSGMDDLKRSLVLYLLVFVRGQLADAGQIDDCFELLKSYIGIMSVRPADSLGGDSTEISSDLRHVLLLFVDVLHIRQLQFPRLDDRLEAGEAPSKKTKRSSPVEAIIKSMFPFNLDLQPHLNWLQFLCLLLERFPEDVPDKFICELIERFKSSLAKHPVDLTCVWICKALVKMGSLPQFFGTNQLSHELSCHWGSIFRHTVEQLKANGLKLDFRTGSLLSLLNNILCHEQVTDSVVTECISGIWNMVVSALRADFLKIPNTEASAREVLPVQEAFVYVVGSVLRLNSLWDQKRHEFSRQNLLFLLFDKVKMWGTAYGRDHWKDEHLKARLGLVAKMIISIVCNASTCLESRSGNLQTGSESGFADETQAIAWKEFGSTESHEEIFLLRLKRLESHMTHGVQIGVSVKKPVLVKRRDHSMISQSASVELQKLAFEQIIGLCEFLEQAANVRFQASFVPLAIEIMQESMEFGTIEACHENLLKPITEILLTDSTDLNRNYSQASLHNFIKSSDTLKFAKEDPRVYSLVVQRYLKVITKYQAFIPSSVNIGLLSTLIENICDLCVKSIQKKDTYSDGMDIDDQEFAVNTARNPRDDVNSKISALDLIIRARSLVGSDFSRSEVDAIRKYVLCADRSWAEVLCCLKLLFNYPDVVTIEISLDLVKSILVKPKNDEVGSFPAITSQKKERVALFSIAQMAENCFHSQSRQALAKRFLTNILDEGSLISIVGTRVEAFEDKSPSEQIKVARDLRREYCVCAGKLILLSEKAQVFDKKLFSSLLKCLSDPAWEVREEVTNAVSYCFSSANPWYVYTSILKIFQERFADKCNLSKVRTRVHTFGHVIALPESQCECSIEANSLFMICKDFRAAENIIVPMLQSVAAARQFPGLSELFGTHMPSILRQWYRAGLNWQDFPFTVAGFSDEKHFISQCAQRYLIPEFSLEGNYEAIYSMGKAKDIGKSKNKYYLQDELFISNILRVWHLATWPMPRDENVATKVETSKELEELTKLARKRFEELQKNNSTLISKFMDGLDDFLIGILDKIIFDPYLEDFGPTSEVRERMSLDAIRKMFVWMGELVQNSESSSRRRAARVLLGYGPGEKSTDRLQRLLLYLMQILKSTKRLREKERVLMATGLLLDTLGEEILCEDHAFAMHHVVWLLLVALGDESIRQEAAKLIKEKVVDFIIAGKNKSGLYRALGPVFEDIVCAMFPYSGGVSSDTKLAVVCRITIESLIINAPSDLNNIIKGLPPFPETDTFKRVRERCRSIRDAEWSLENDLQVFIDGSEHVNAEVQKVRLQHLCAQLKAGGASGDLSRIRRQEAQSEDGYLLTMCVCKLLRLGRVFQSNADGCSEILDVVAKCLGQIGPVVSKSLSLSLLRPSHLPQVKICGARGSSTKGKLQISNSKIYIAILQTLRVYLADPDFECVQEASFLLKNMFSNESRWNYREVLSTKSEAVTCSDALDRSSNLWTLPYENSDSLISPTVIDPKDTMLVDNRDLWFPKSANFSQWITKLMYHLCIADRSDDKESGNKVWQLCAKMCRIKSDFAELLFPHLLFSICMNASNIDLSEILKDVLLSTTSNLQSVRLVLHALDFIRSFRQDVIKLHAVPCELLTTVQKWKYHFYFDIPYNIVAQASLRCDAPFNAILYMELYSTVQLTPTSGSRRSSAFDQDRQKSRNEMLMLDAYRHIDEPDGVRAYNLRHEIESHLITFEKEEDWGKSLGIFDTLLSSESDFQDGMPSDLGVRAVSAMHNFGFTHLPLVASRHLCGVNSETVCEALWRSSKWDTSEEESYLSGRSQCEVRGFNGHLLDALRALQKLEQAEGQIRQVEGSLFSARLVVMRELTGRVMQSTQNSYHALVRLQCCQDVSDSSNTLLTDRFRQQESFNGLFQRWCERYSSLQNRFVLQEPAMALHGVLLRICASDHVFEQLCISAKHALKQGNVSYARCAMQKLQVSLRETGITKHYSLWLRQAKVLWHDKLQDQALKILSDLETHLECKGEQTKDDQKLLARVLAVNAEWLSTTRTAGWEEISGKMSKGLEIRREMMPLAKTHFKLATFMDSMYCHEELPDLDKINRQNFLLQNLKQEMQINSAMRKEKAETARITQRIRQLELEIDERKKRQKHREKFMEESLNHYLHHIHLGGINTKIAAIFRVLHIWFENREVQSVNTSIRKEVEEIAQLDPFAILVPQLVSRLDSISLSDSGFQETLRLFLSLLLERCPDDSLFPIFAAKNENRHRPHSASVTYETNESRIKAAGELINSEKRRAETLPDFERTQRIQLLRQTEELIDGYIALADLVVDKNTIKGNFSADIPEKLKRIRWTQDHSHVPVPTNTESRCMVSKFKETWTYPGGITVPKKILCEATNGRKFSQIVKGGDDSRCDAVTSQLFSVMGMLLRDDAACRRRQLHINRYKVIPLHPEAGLIQFVEDAIALNQILGDATTEGAQTVRTRQMKGSSWENRTNQRIRNEIISINERFKKAGDLQSTAHWSERLKHFRKVLGDTRPVFRHYLFEKPSSAPKWFQMRLDYTRSVAASSIAGFISGLGDRHTGNILVVENSGEVVHIDLGIVFEQGRLLSEPETIPFRLTREIVDGFGVAGTAGVFTRCCEETLRVLRDNKQALLAIIDVLVHDPLMSWKMTPGKEKRAGGSRKENQQSGIASGADGEAMELGGENAEMVLKKVKDKLEGRDRGEMLGVEGQVKQLIQDARSDENLSRVYLGWLAWL